MSELIDRIKAFDDFCSLDAVDVHDVEKAEQALRLSFADDYKEYVLTFGAATFGGRELTGVCNSKRLSVISTTERARRFYHCFPLKLYVIEELLVDHVLVVQDAEGSVYYYGPEDEATPIAKSLQEYLFPESITTDIDADNIKSLEENIL